MSRLASFLALAGVVLLLIPLSSAVAAHLPAFSLSEPALLTANRGAIDYELVTVTNNYRRPIVIQNPAIFTADRPFFDTQAGSCWQTYGALGQSLPGLASCTIQVGFNPPLLSPFNAYYDANMTVSMCVKSRIGAGAIACDIPGGSQTITVHGYATAPDLIVQNIALGDGGATSNGYTVTVKNDGTGPADLAGSSPPLTSVGVQGWYSVDTTIDGTDSPACGKAMTGTLAAGATTNVVVGCTLGPTAAGMYLLIHVDATNALTESDETNNVGILSLP